VWQSRAGDVTPVQTAISSRSRPSDRTRTSRPTAG